MSLLDGMSLVDSGPVPPMICTIMGDAGTGKTSLAALFPKPLIIRLEDGTKSISNKNAVMQTPVLLTSADVVAWLSDIYADPKGVQTIAFDSVTKLNSIIEDEVVASDRKKPAGINTACGGYGAGHNAVARIHRGIKAWCDSLARDHGINVLFIAHSKIETLDTPDTDPFARYGLKMNKQSFAVYTDDVDMVAHLKHNIVVLKGDSEMSMSKVHNQGGISIQAMATPSSLAKNRYEITEPIPFVKDVFPFNSIIQTGAYVKDFDVNKQTGEVNG